MTGEDWAFLIAFGVVAIWLAGMTWLFSRPTDHERMEKARELNRKYGRPE